MRWHVGMRTPTAPPPIVRMSPVLRRQHGVIATAQAAAVGVDRRTLSAMVARGELIRLSRGVYRSVTWPDTWQARWMAALLAVGDDTVVSHGAAAWLHGLTHLGVGTRPELELVTPRVTDTRIPDVTVHTAVHVTAGDVAAVDGFRATTVAWTLASLARRLTPQRLERGVDAAVAAERLTFDEFAAVALRFRWCPGMATIREVLQRHLPDVRLTRSQWERLFLRWVHEDGLPAPVPNHPVMDDDGNRRLLDAAWPDYLVCAEVDLHPDHRRTLGRHADGRRQNALVSQWTVLRFDELDMRFGRAQVLAEVRRALRAAGAPV